MDEIERMKVENELLKLMIKVLVGAQSGIFIQANFEKTGKIDHSVGAEYRNALKQGFHIFAEKLLQDRAIGKVLADDLLKEFEDRIFLGELTNN